MDREIQRIRKSKTPPVPLSETEQTVFNVIWAKGPLSAKEIANETGISLPVLYNHVIPALKSQCGLLNKKSRGYYFPD